MTSHAPTFPAPIARSNSLAPTAVTAGMTSAWYRAERMARLTHNIEQADADIAELERRIRKWVYAPEKLILR